MVQGWVRAVKIPGVCIHQSGLGRREKKKCSASEDKTGQFDSLLLPSKTYPVASKDDLWMRNAVGVKFVMIR